MNQSVTSKNFTFTMRGRLLQKNNHLVPLQKETSIARVVGEAELKSILYSFNNSLSSVHLVVTN